MPFLGDGLGVKIPFQGVLNDRFEVILRMDYFHCFVMCPDRPVSVPWSLEIIYHLLSFFSHSGQSTTCHTTIGSHRGMHRDHLVYPEGEKVKHCHQQT